MRRTQAQLAVAAAFLDSPDGRHYGYTLWRTTGVKPGALYPMLARFERSGLLRSRWQELETLPPNQSLPRKYYTLTDKGRVELSALVNGVSDDRTR
jgi:PadR family transcriptional regulator PadR